MQVDDDLCLRRLVPSDAPNLVRTVRANMDYIGRTERWAYFMNENAERRGISHATDMAEAGRAAPYGVFLRRRLVGSVVLHSFAENNNYAKLGYWRVDDEEVRGRGIITRSAAHVVRMGMGHLGLAAIGVEMRPDNVPSRHVAERLGAQFLGVAEGGMLAYAIIEPPQV